MILKLMMMCFLDCNHDEKRSSTSVSFSFFFRWCEEISSGLSPLRDENGMSRLVAPWFEFENFFRRGETRKTRDDFEKFQNFSPCLSLSLFSFLSDNSAGKPGPRISGRFRCFPFLEKKQSQSFCFLSFPVERATDRASASSRE